MKPRIRNIFVIGCLGLLASCGPEEKSAAPAVKTAPAVKPADESRRFPKAELTETRVVDDHAMGKSFLPGGTVASYRKGQYEMFLVKMADAQSSAIALLDWKKELADAKLIPAFGGYFGKDGGRPVFVFTKGPWVAGVAGLNEKDADAKARLLASQISF
ncbi:MAG: hypothetical protein JST93_25260 [Acidobacteria bacterium]|nr:hypothetical protein [Acidobacteriota bacterium]